MKSILVCHKHEGEQGNVNQKRKTKRRKIENEEKRLKGEKADCMETVLKCWVVNCLVVGLCICIFKNQNGERKHD